MGKMEELQDTAFLVEKLSNLVGVLRAELNDEEYSDTDTWVISETGTRTPVQNVTSEGKTLKNMNINTRAFGRSQSFVVEEVNHFEWVVNAIKSKEAKNYSHADKLILVIHAAMPTLPAYRVRDMLDINICSSFAGIYYVCIPNSSPESGYVIALKKYWSTGDIF